MNLSISFTFVGLFVLLVACVDNSKTEAYGREKIKNAVVDSTLFTVFSKYNNLYCFLDDHRKEILDYRDTTGIHYYNSDSGLDSTGCESYPCHVFIYGSNTHQDHLNVPIQLRAHLDSLCDQIDEENLIAFKVCREGETRITLRRIQFKHFYILHQLIWNIDSMRDYSFSIANKDIRIDSIIYRIGAQIDY